MLNSRKASVTYSHSFSISVDKFLSNRTLTLMIFCTMSNISLMSTLILTLAIYTLNVNAQLSTNDTETIEALKTVFQKWDGNMERNKKNNIRKNGTKMVDALDNCKKGKNEMSGVVDCLRTFLYNSSLRMDLFAAPGNTVQSDIDEFINQNENKINAELKTLLTGYKTANVFYGHDDE